MASQPSRALDPSPALPRQSDASPHADGDRREAETFHRYASEFDRPERTGSEGNAPDGGGPRFAGDEFDRNEFDRDEFDRDKFDGHELDRDKFGRDEFDRDAGPDGLDDLSPAETPQRFRGGWLSGARGVAIGLGAGVLLTLAGTFVLGDRGSESASAPPDPAPAAATEGGPVQSVTVAPAEPTAIARSLDASGSVAARELIPVTAQASGLQIRELYADEGDFVQAGQVLAKLDDAVLRSQQVQAQAGVREAEAALAELRAGTRSEEVARARESVRNAEAAVERARANLELAQQRVERNQFLGDQGAIARDRLDEVTTTARTRELELDQAQASLQEARQTLQEKLAGPRPQEIARAEARLAQARGQLQQVEAQLRETVVRAPAAGKVAERNARLGDLTSGSDRLFSLIENGALELQLQVPETRLGQVRPGQPVAVTSDADGSLKLTGTVREIDPLVDPDSRQATVRVDLPAAEGLRPGAFLRGAIATEYGRGLAVPAAALLPQSDGSTRAFRLNPDGTATAVAVETGQPLPGDRVEVRGGLNPGDRVVVEGASYLKDGDRVEVQN